MLLWFQQQWLVSGDAGNITGVSQQGQGFTPPGFHRESTAGTPGGFTVTGDSAACTNLKNLRTDFLKHLPPQELLRFGGTELGWSQKGEELIRDVSAVDYEPGESIYRKLS